jgi:uncharacterized protein YjbI with pentapeptide repeats
MSGAQLSGAQLSGTQLSGLNCRGSIVGAQLSGLNCRGSIVGAQLSGAQLSVYQNVTNVVFFLSPFLLKYVDLVKIAFISI